MTSSDSIVLHNSTRLEKQMLLNSIIVAYTCDCNPLTNGSVLSRQLCTMVMLYIVIPQRIEIHSMNEILFYHPPPSTDMFTSKRYINFDKPAGTHYVKNILVSSPAPGEIIVTGDFLNSSTTTGLLVIAYTSSSNVRYHLYSRTPNEQDFRTVINNLEGGDYHVSVFTVENGLPFSQAAVQPWSVYVPSTEG